MNIKELIAPLLLGLLSVVAINYFFFGGKQPRPGQTQSFIAPTGEQQVKPLNTEIDFVDSKRSFEEVQTTVETPLASYVFSSDGACLYQLDFKRLLAKTASTIPTIFQLPAIDRENRCFLVAFDEKTPYYYQFMSRTENDATVQLVYQAPCDGWLFTKKFTVYKNTYQIDVELSVAQAAENGGPVKLRLFFPSPIMPELGTYEIISCIVGDEQGSIRKTVRSRIDVNQGWILPKIFGAESKYFVHTMCKDPQAFCQRAYYKLYDQERITSILEGPAVTKAASWNLSFYFGPKESSALILVDGRLEQTLDYSGWFAPLARLLLAFLIFLFGYLHNYGLAIIVMTILIRLLLMPLSIHGERAMKQQAEVQKKMNYIKARYKDDPVRSAEEQAELMRTQGLPGLAGCLPMLLQIPVFLVLNRVLSSSIELYKAPFAFWITDLSAKDPYYVLPVLITISMLLTITAPTGKNDARQRLFMVMMALMFGAFSAAWSSGLSLYLLVSSLFGLLQTFIQRRFMRA